MFLKQARSTKRRAPSAWLLVGALLAGPLCGGGPALAQFPPPIGGGDIVIDAPEVVNGVEGTPITFQFTVTGPSCDLTFLRTLAFLPEGNDATLTGCVPLDFGFGCPAIDGSQTFTFTWTPTCEDAGEYDISLGAAYRSRECPRGGTSDVVHIFVAEGCNGGEPQFGSVSGQVTADCPTPATALLGVTVDAVEVGTGELAGSAVTDADGNYLIPDLPVGLYTLVVSVPLGYTTATNEHATEILADQTVDSDFALECQTTPSAPRTIGFWKHQFAVATSGRGTAQIDAATLCSYLDLVEGHFNTNAVNEVVIYMPPVSGTCDDKLVVAKGLLNLHGSVDMIERARQQLLALLLNAASGKVGIMNAASADGATISQAITYCDNLIDDPDGDHEKAKTIADLINNGEVVPAGMIPLETANIAYRRGLLEFAAGPSPSSGPRVFRFAMARGGHVSLAVYDVAGRKVAHVFTGVLNAGRHTLAWNGRTSLGTAPSAGIYFTRLSMGDESRTLKLIETTR